MVQKGVHPDLPKNRDIVHVVQQHTHEPQVVLHFPVTLRVEESIGYVREALP